MEQEQQQWRKFSGEWINIPIADEVNKVLIREKELGHELKVCIGTDSQVKGRETEFATVIVFIRKGKGGFMYIHNEITRQKMSIKQRMLLEVAKSIEVAYALCGIFTLYHIDMEVHADINTNPNFKSNDALKEAMGYIMRMARPPARLSHSGGDDPAGRGFAFKVKPEAFASSSCANKVVQ
ncbi:ribonuclease H-like YkuK family protein [Agriterribacter sp.]|uniref:ribonuclease H-like YkuK family protein n=1 Tax=Agriterribacter sp. TaxID=2821509 RepID=UPI002B9358F3|nr:ribonuclease H-like YkuK family protein [Agriterribacter sp.]HTN05185.1 ribonuclease H-like YkuK family protein [Agriterribacter sp.]